MTALLLTPVRDTTWSSWFVGLVVLYYAALWVLALASRHRVPSNDFHPTVVLLVPARNEERVIGGTLRALLELEYDDFLVVVVDDGSTDRTAEIARRVQAIDNRVLVIERPADIAGTGKSDVLNHGFNVVRSLLLNNDQLLKGRSASEVLIGVVDADGYLDRQTLAVVAPYFGDPRTGQLQIGVKIYNASASILTRMQDMEFVGFTSLVQVARARLGSSGLGGNGQFTRLTALLDLGGQPWNPHSLTEDLDLGIRMVINGWVTQYTNAVNVHQQGLTRWVNLMRQRTRWIQGHYQCWRYIPDLLFTKRAKLTARADLINYLLLVVTVVVVSFNLVVGILGSLGILEVHNSFLTSFPEGYRRVAEPFFMFTPIVAFTFTYQRYSDHPLRWWEVPAFSCIFSLYCYVWVIATIRAWTRMLLRRNKWTKTTRVPGGRAGRHRRRRSLWDLDFQPR